MPLILVWKNRFCLQTMQSLVSHICPASMKRAPAPVHSAFLRNLTRHPALLNALLH
jgi:hypothetical protein